MFSLTFHQVEDLGKDADELEKLIKTAAGVNTDGGDYPSRMVLYMDYDPHPKIPPSRPVILPIPFMHTGLAAVVNGTMEAKKLCLAKENSSHPNSWTLLYKFTQPPVEVPQYSETSMSSDDWNLAKGSQCSVNNHSVSSYVSSAIFSSEDDDDSSGED